MNTEKQEKKPSRRRWRTQLARVGACSDARAWCREQPDARTAWETCERGDWLIWIAARVVTDPEDRKLVVLTVCEIAETAQRPGLDHEARACTETVRAWARGEATIEQVREGRRAVYAARADAYAAAVYAAASAAYDAADAAAAYAADAADAAADAAAYAAAYDAADAAARSAHLKKLADVVRARIPIAAIGSAFRAAQESSQ